MKITNLCTMAIGVFFLSTVSNAQTKVFQKEEFKQWAQIPPMGWNSWDCYGPTVEEHEVKANTDYLSLIHISEPTRPY